VDLVSFWLTIILFVVVGFMLLNNFYWRNVKAEQKYNRERLANKEE
jgi:hypothetical protein